MIFIYSYWNWDGKAIICKFSYHSTFQNTFRTLRETCFLPRSTVERKFAIKSKIE